MLHLYIGRHFGDLFDKYIGINKQQITPLFSKKEVLVPNRMTGAWLSQRLAEKEGINADLNPVFSASFFNVQLQKLLPEVVNNNLNGSVLQLNIASLFNDKGYLNEYPRITDYLHKTTEADHIKLAGKVRDIFDHYQVYRREWLDSWNANRLLDLGDDEVWQKGLWNKLNIFKNDFAIDEELEKALASRSCELPETICLFGISSLPPTHIALLLELAKYCEIHIFTLANIDTDNVASEISHWHSTSVQFLGAFSDIQGPTVLTDTSLLQKSSKLNSLQNYFLGSSVTTENDPNDQSINIVSCYTPMREVEALHDYLLSQFKEDPELTPGDVLIAIPELDKYVPFIRAVFDTTNNSDNDCYAIPYILNGGSISESPLFTGLLELLDITTWRFTREQVVSLLRNRLIKNRFELTDSDLELLDSWLDESAIRWGIDAEHRAEFNLPAIAENTWRAGFDRLLVGSILPKKISPDSPLFRGVLPVDDIEGSLLSVLCRFIEFAELLFSWRVLFKESYDINVWSSHLQSLVSDFFAIDENYEADQIQLFESIDLLKSNAEQAKFSDDLCVSSIKVLLNDALQTTKRSARLSGSVNFCEMKSMAGIPFNKICLLGMNHNSWPTQSREPSFDLMQAHHKNGDRNRSNDQRLVTLQLMQAAQQSLYISYVGRDIHSGEHNPPSVMVSEILYAAENAGIELQTQNHPMHIYSSDNFQGHSILNSHNSSWFNIAQYLGKGERELPTLFDKQAAVSSKLVTHIDVNDLCNFFVSPQKAFLKESLGVYITDHTNEWENNEPFSLENFVDSKVRSISINQGLSRSVSDAANSPMQIAKASGILPHGIYGELLQQREQKGVDELLSQVTNSFKESSLEPITIDIMINGINITGTLTGIKADGQLDILSDQKIYDYKKIQYWIKHLLLAILAPQGVQCITQIQTVKEQLFFSEVTNPKALLADWMDAYCAGLSYPLPFFPKVSYAYVKEYLSNNKNKNPLKKAQDKWEDSYLYPGEKSKPHNKYLYREHSPLDDSFAEISLKLLEPLINAQGE